MDYVLSTRLATDGVCVFVFEGNVCLCVCFIMCVSVFACPCVYKCLYHVSRPSLSFDGDQQVFPASDHQCAWTGTCGYCAHCLGRERGWSPQPQGEQWEGAWKGKVLLGGSWGAEAFELGHTCLSRDTELAASPAPRDRHRDRDRKRQRSFYRTEQSVGQKVNSRLEVSVLFLWPRGCPIREKRR